MIESFTAATFRPLLGEPFELGDDARAMEVRLAEVNDAGRFHREMEQGDADRRRPFSLLFHGPLSPVWPQKIYRLTGEKLGTFDLFLVPVGPRGDAMGYEAVFT
jgi:hypothetical protein